MLDIQSKRLQILQHLKKQSFEGEVWKEFVYTSKSPSDYIVWHISNFGRVAKNYKITYGKQHSNGYMFLGNMTPVHRLVAIHFIPKMEEDVLLGRKYVDHIDGDKTNNHYLNLRWCTISENNNFELARKRNSTSKRGELNHNYGVPPKNKGKILYNDGAVCRYYDVGTAPEGWKVGRIR